MPCLALPGSPPCRFPKSTWCSGLVLTRVMVEDQRCNTQVRETQHNPTGLNSTWKPADPDLAFSGADNLLRSCERLFARLNASLQQQGDADTWRPSKYALTPRFEFRMALEPASYRRGTRAGERGERVQGT